MPDEQSHILDEVNEEIAWLRSFGWPDERIAVRLQITVAAIRKRDLRRDQGRIRVQKTHCPHGHAYTEENIYLKPSGVRQCRTCIRARRIKTCDR